MSPTAKSKRGFWKNRKGWVTMWLMEGRDPESCTNSLEKEKGEVARLLR